MKAERPTQFSMQSSNASILSCVKALQRRGREDHNRTVPGCLICPSLYQRWGVLLHDGHNPSTMKI